MSSDMLWVRLNKYLKDTGEARSTWYALKDNGELLEGVHFRYDSKNRVWVNLKAMAAWVEGKQPKRTRSR
ncbi:hypothetical protein GCM10009104_08660 [Marinobacterium maritimum]|uniref:Excisionase n=1 Tax=Marinobacterium maritimum TaxID=500162 RepID=A0ABP3T9E9_9GAMM